MAAGTAWGAQKGQGVTEGALNTWHQLALVLCPQGPGVLPCSPVPSRCAPTPRDPAGPQHCAGGSPWLGRRSRAEPGVSGLFESSGQFYCARKEPTSADFGASSAGAAPAGWRDQVPGSKTPEAGLAGALFARAGLGLGMHSADAGKLQISLPTNPTKRATRM